MPPAALGAVVLNLTVTTPPPVVMSRLPERHAAAAVSSINFTKGWTGANLVTVPVGANGKIDLYNSSSSAT